MKQHEREFFVASIRSGIVINKNKGIVLKVHSPTIEHIQDASEIYNSHYREAYEDGVMTEEETFEWMEAKELWTSEDDESLELLEKEIESCKERIYQSRYVPQTVENLRTVIDTGREQLLEARQKKGYYSPNTCEGMASLEKARYLIKTNTYLNGELYDFSLIDVDTVLSAYNSSILSEEAIREIARTDPWKVNWYMKDVDAATMFANKGRELTPNQKNLIIWSKMYDSVQESMDCPSDDVVNDDDMLDGWFILQKKKRDQEKVQSEIEQSTSNPKISNSDEIFVMADSQKDANKINNSNTHHVQQIKKQRMAVIKHKGTATDLDFQDQQLKMRQQSNEMFKGKFRR